MIKKIGKWRLIRPLSKSTKEVIRVSFLAEDTETKNIVALTVLNQNYHKDQALVEEVKHGVSAYNLLGSNDGLMSSVEYDVYDNELFVINSYLPRAKPLEVWLAQGFIFKETEILAIAKQLFDVLQLSNTRGIVFGNLMPTFILYDPESIRICIATLPLKRTNTSSFLAMARVIGNPYYRPPEFFTENGKPSLTEDIYAAFMILYNLCMGRQIHEKTADFGAACMAVVNKKTPLLPSNIGLSTGFQKLIDQGLKKDRNKRLLLVNEIIEKLEILAITDSPIVSSNRLKTIINQHYPTPITHQVKLISDEDQNPAFRLKQLELSITTALQLFGSVLLCIKEENNVLKRNKDLARATLGQWLHVIRNQAHELYLLEEYQWLHTLMEIFICKGKHTQIFDKLIHWRNSVAHGVQNDHASISTALETGLELYWTLCRKMTFITRYKLIHVDYLQYQDHTFLTKFIQFRGNKPSVMSTILDNPLPCNAVLLCDRNLQNYVNLTGFIRYEACQHKECDLNDLFFYQSIKRDIVHYFSFHRGHVFTEKKPDQNIFS